MRRAWNLVQSVGDRADEVFHPVTSDSRNWMELKVVVLAEITKGFKPRAIGGGVQLGGDDDHRFFCERRAKGMEFAIDDFEGMNRVISVRIARVDQMNEEARAFDVAEEANAEAGAFVRAFDEAGQIGDDESAAELRAMSAGAAVSVDNAKVGLERSEWIVGNFRARGRDYRDQGGFAHVGEAHKANIREELEFEAEMTLFAGKSIFVFARGLVPRLREVLIATPTPATMHNKYALAWCGKIRDGFAALRVESERAHRNLQDHVLAGVARAVGTFAVAAAISLELAVVAVTEQRVVVWIGFEINGAAIAAVAAGGAAARNIFFAAKSYAAVAAVAGLHEYFGFINKHGKNSKSVGRYAAPVEKDNISALSSPGNPNGGHLSMPRVLKRIAVLLLALAIVVAGDFHLLYFRRVKLPAAAPHARMVPAISTIPGLAACWVETGKTFSSFSFGLTAGSIVVKHPAGDLLIDTGNSSHFNEEVGVYPFWLWLKLKSLAGQLNPSVPLPNLLQRIGEDPAKLRWAILSHVHLDHAGGLMDLPRMPVLLTREELQFANDPKVQAKGFTIAAHTEKFPPIAAPTLKFAPTPYETFDESVDLYKDGSVVVVPLRGHTPGSVGIFVNLSPARRLFYVGDSVDDERGFEERVGKSLVLRDSDNDRTLANQIVSRLTELHQRVPGLAILPAHGRSAYKKFFPGGPFSCVFGQ